MHEKILKVKDVCERLNISSTSLWRYRKAGVFPDPVSISGSPSLKGWTEKDVNKWIDDNFSIQKEG